MIIASTERIQHLHSLNVMSNIKATAGHGFSRKKGLKAVLK